jgi:hypothetical protein
MANLYIAVTGADEDVQRRALEALQGAGIEVYRSWIEAKPVELAEANAVPKRDFPMGQRVKLTLNPWASNGPTEGAWNGQGERGLSIRVEGGGRFIYAHHEVAKVELVGAPGE